MNVQFIASAIMMSSAGLCFAAEPSIINPDQAQAWLAKTPNTQVLDVRSEEEFATGHLDKSLIIPWGEKNFLTRVAKELDRKKPLLVYCRSGRRSTEAVAALVKLGYTELCQLEGGMLAWKAAGKPIVKP